MSTHGDGGGPLPADPWQPPPNWRGTTVGAPAPANPRAAPESAGFAVAARIAVPVILLGAPAGLLWSRISPQPDVVREAGSLTIANLESEVFLGADAWFLFLTAGLGVVTGLVVWLVRRGHGAAVAVGVAVGGLAAAKVAQTVGQRVVLHDRLQRLCSAMEGCVLYDGTLHLRAGAVVLAWPIAALITLAVLTAVLDREPDRAATATWPASDWSYPAG